MAALPAVRAGKRVLMIERGDWVPRSAANWGADGFFSLTSAYSSEAAYTVNPGDKPETLGMIACVGGASVFYGGVALRLRERDFDPRSGSRYRFRRRRGRSPTRNSSPTTRRPSGCSASPGAPARIPPNRARSTPYPQAPAPLAPISRRMADVARGLGTPSVSLAAGDQLRKRRRPRPLRTLRHLRWLRLRRRARRTTSRPR